MTLLAIALSYIIGSISTAYIVVKAVKGIDIRTVGSGNAGATNVKRVLGTGPAIIVLALDIVKGVLAVNIGRWAGGEVASLACGVAVVVGHNWPLFFGLKGGKGSATSLGVILTVSPMVTILVLVIGVGTIAVTKYVSLGSIIVAPIYVIAMAITYQTVRHTIFALILAIMVLYRHRENIVRLLEGRESKLGETIKKVK